MLYSSATVIYGNAVFDGNKADVSFNDSSAGLNGGAICTTGELIIYYAEFKNNSARYYGGAIHASYTSEDKVPRVTSIKSAKFDSNTAKGGGAIMVSNTSVSLDNVIATGNTATSKGGGFAYLSNSELTIKGGSISGSVCNDASGGAFYMAGSELNLLGTEASPIILSGNTTVGNGGAICAYIATEEIVKGQDSDGNDIIETISTRSTVNATYVSFNENTSTTSSPYGGGAIYSSNSDITISNSTFDGNSAIYGGAISLFSTSVLTGSDLTFTNNTAKVNGGVMYTSKSTAVFTNVIANGNQATGYTKIENVLDEETGEPTGETTESVVKGNGGVFYINSTSTFSTTHLSASSNVAYNGGFMYAAYSEITFDGENEFNENSAISTGSQDGGGAFYISDCTGSIKNAEITSCTAANGGAVAIFKADSFEFIDCTFDKNTVTSTGGTFYVNTSNIAIKGCTVSGSDADSNGGVLYSTSSKSIAISNSTFDGNDSASGVIYLTKTTLVSTNDKYLNNTSKYGLFYVNSGSSLTINNGTMNNNTASKLGAGIYMPNGTLAIDGLSATGNSVTGGNGGVICISSKAGVTSTATINNATFTSNSAEIGGAIHVSCDLSDVTETKLAVSTLTVSNSKFVGNQATLDSADGKGGAISINNGAVVTLNDVTFESNTAAHGGAIGFINGTLTINGIVASDNEATGYTNNGSMKSGNGGAINIGTGSFTLNKGTTITENKFIDNVAHAGGGAIYCYDTTTILTIEQITCTGNEATTNYGGAIYIRGGSITVDIGDVVANGNSASNGGAIYLYAFKNGTIDSIVANNNVSTNGGAIYVAGSCTVDIGSVSGEGNSATTSGGFAYVGTSTTTIRSASIGENNDKNNVALYISAASLKVNLNDFTYPEGSINDASKLVQITE